MQLKCMNWSYIYKNLKTQKHHVHLYIYIDAVLAYIYTILDHLYKAFRHTKKDYFFFLNMHVACSIDIWYSVRTSTGMIQDSSYLRRQRGVKREGYTGNITL